MINIKTASLAIALTVLTTAADAQSVIRYSDAQGYGYRMEPLYPYAPPQRGVTRVETPASAPARPVSQVDPALVAELRKKRKASTKPDTKPKAHVEAAASGEKATDKKKITRTIVVRQKPIVRKSYRVVEHPPLIVRREVSEDQVGESGHVHPAQQHAPLAGRTIRAEAEITILGPDRMSIRLYRKQDGSDANARAAKPAANLAAKRSAGAEGKTKIR